MKINIPEHELEITASRAGGPGGQHVNKSNTKIIIRWNFRASNSLSEEQKSLIQEKLINKLTESGDLVIQNSSTRSQDQNRKLAIDKLNQVIEKALFIPKKRKATKIPKAKKESRLQAKKARSQIKKLRSEKLT